MFSSWAQRALAVQLRPGTAGARSKSTSTHSPANQSRSEILLVSELFPPAVGGSAVLLKNVYERLAESSVTVLTGESAPPLGGDGRLTVVRRPMSADRWGILTPAGLGRHLRTARSIRSLAASPHAIVHCGRALPEGVSALVARSVGGARYVCWTHGEELAYARSSRELGVLMRLVHRGAAAVIANSRNSARLLVSMGVSAERVHVVYPGVDATRFHPGAADRRSRQAMAPHGELVMLSVGRLQSRKGHDLAIAALDSIRQEIPGLRYVIAGDGEERQRLERIVSERGLRDAVTFAGNVPDEALPALYAASDFFVHPNRVEGEDFEGFGIVFLEAAASGRAVIGGATGGVPEAVEEGVTGLLVGGTDPQELAGAIRRLALSAELRQRMGQAGRRRVLTDFTWERAAAKVSALQAALISGE